MTDLGGEREQPPEQRSSRVRRRGASGLRASFRQSHLWQPGWVWKPRLGRVSGAGLKGSLTFPSRASVRSVASVYKERGFCSSFGNALDFIETAKEKTAACCFARGAQSFYRNVPTSIEVWGNKATTAAGRGSWHPIGTRQRARSLPLSPVTNRAVRQPAAALPFVLSVF